VQRVEPVPVGTIVDRGGRPAALHAVVHDLSCDPSWTEDAVARALAGVLRHVGATGGTSLALPLLGRVHGRLPVDRLVPLLLEALVRQRPAHLRRIWLVAPHEDARELGQLLELPS
jgi:hypothetical protein